MAETDLTALPSVTEETVVQLLRDRFDRSRIFTKLGDEVLLKVNPFEDVTAAGDQEPNGPRIEDLASRAFTDALRTREPFSCVMTGESGAGKTEATKVYLKELAGGSRCANQQLQVQLVDSCTLLESFGNCATEHNHNSSRFARWFELRISPSHGRVVSGRVHQYLLEKGRVVSGSDKSSNFHVLYDICQSFADAEAAANDALQRESHFAYLRDRATDKGLADRWKRMVTQLGHMGVGAEDLAALADALWCVLYLGNLEFNDVDAGGGAEGCEVTAEAQDDLRRLTRLLGMGEDIAAVTALFAVRRLRTGRGITEQTRTAAQAREARDALAKDLYSRIFRYIIRVINQSIDGQQVAEEADAARDAKVTVSILDIFGFERFENNSFEQLCINYGNEKLVQQFHEVLVRAEVAVCREEGVPEGSIGVEDAYEREQATKEATLRGIDSAFKVIQDATRFGHSTDTSLTKKLLELNLGGPVKLTRVGNPIHFTVNHYAGLVVYNADGFLDKNRDESPRDVGEVITEKSASHFLRSLFSDAENEDQGAGGASKQGASKPKAQGKQKTLGVQFRDEFSALANELASSRQQFVMCIKPNREAKPADFRSELVRDQLEANGTLTICKVRQSAFAEHVPHKTFVERYAFLAPNKDDAKDAASLAAALTGPDGVIDAGDLFIGKTRILLRAQGRDQLDVCCEERARAAARMQAAARRFVARRAFLRQRKAAVQIQTAVRGQQARASVAAQRVEMNRAAVKVQSLFRMIVARAEADEKRFVRQRLAATRVQAFARTALAVRKFQRALKLARWRRQKETSAIAIQAVVRRWLRKQRQARAQRRLDMQKAAAASLAATLAAKEAAAAQEANGDAEDEPEDLAEAETQAAAPRADKPRDLSLVNGVSEDDRVNAAIMTRATIPRGRRKPSKSNAGPVNVADDERDDEPRSSAIAAPLGVGVTGAAMTSASEGTPSPPPPLPLQNTVKAIESSKTLSVATPPVTSSPPATTPKPETQNGLPPAEPLPKKESSVRPPSSAAMQQAASTRPPRGTAAAQHLPPAQPADDLDLDRLVQQLGAIRVQREWRQWHRKVVVQRKMASLRATENDINESRELLDELEAGRAPPTLKVKTKSMSLGKLTTRLRTRKGSSSNMSQSSRSGLRPSRGSNLSQSSLGLGHGDDISDDGHSQSGRPRRLSTQIRRFGSAFRTQKAFMEKYGTTEEAHYSAKARNNPRWNFLLPSSSKSGNSPTNSAQSPPPSADPEYGPLMQELDEAANQRNVSDLTRTLAAAYDRGYISGREVETAEAVLAQIRKVHLRQLELEEGLESEF